jgi:hypothetical protein
MLTQISSEVRVHDNIPTTHIAVAVEGVILSSPNYYPMLTMQSILGNWDCALSSVLLLSSHLSDVISKHSLCICRKESYSTGMSLTLTSRLITDAMQGCDARCICQEGIWYSTISVPPQLSKHPIAMSCTSMAVDSKTIEHGTASSTGAVAEATEGKLKMTLVEASVHGAWVNE